MTDDQYKTIMQALARLAKETKDVKELILDVVGDVADYIQAQALPVETSEKRAIAAALEAAATPKRVPRLAARMSYPGEGELIG